jgi:hypothetical protein
MTVFRTILAVFKEIFEESAYERFCAREKLDVSPESYTLFLRETDQARRQQIRCC